MIPLREATLMGALLTICACGDELLEVAEVGWPLTEWLARDAIHHAQQSGDARFECPVGYVTAKTSNGHDYRIRFHTCLFLEMYFHGKVRVSFEETDDQWITTYRGRVRWSGGVADGTCSVDFRQVVVDDDPAQLQPAEGEICGHPAELIEPGD